MPKFSLYLLAFVAFSSPAAVAQEDKSREDNSIVSTPTPEAPNGPAWAMPVQALDELLPRWLQFNAQYRNRVEQSGHIGFKHGSDTYDLSQLRLQIAIQPNRWLRMVAETQDARIFFNSKISSAPPYQNRWDIRQAFIQLGSDKDGWFDVIGGREMLSFGDERLIGPSDWLNQGRTFDVVRADPPFRISHQHFRFLSDHCERWGGGPSFGRQQSLRDL